MATYKLMQDIEAEDHILGPLSLRQFIFALIAVFFFYINFILVTRHLAFLTVLFLPPALFFGFFAMPFGKDQPTEVWALAKLRFWFKPRKRIWDQSGVKELVTITVPKKIERVLTNGLDQEQVESRLKALASTIDSRGWAIKNVSTSAYANAIQLAPAESDRLIDPSSLPQAVPIDDTTASDDVLDEVNNPIARQFDQMITKTSEQHRQELIDQFNEPSPPPQPARQQSKQQVSDPADFWFMNQTDLPAGGGSAIAPAIPDSINPIRQAQDATEDESAMVAESKALNAKQRASKSHLRTLRPIDDSPPPPPKDDMQYYPEGAEWQEPESLKTAQPVNISADPPMTPPPDPVILNLANNNDLNVATLAREAYKVKHNDDESPRDEVVISLR